MTASIRGLAWIGLYVMLALLPLGAAAIDDSLHAPRSWRIEFSVALGFIALALLMMQFGLVSRLEAASRPFGSDALMQFHRRMGIVALLFVMAHPVLLSGSMTWSSWNPFHGSAATKSGALATWMAAVVVLSSLFRRRIRLSYEIWQLIHLVGACVIVAAALVHVFRVGGYSRSAAMQWTLAAYIALFVVLLLRYRLIRPLMLWRRPWEVVTNRDLGASTRLLHVRPLGHAGFRFEAGQFGWLLTGATPLWSGQHPLSIASSAHSPSRDGVEFAVKALGDWSSTEVPAFEPGRCVWIDGPFGAFAPLGLPADGFVLIAGGIGIAPMRSILLSMRDRGDQRPVLLFYAARDFSRAPFQEELQRLGRDLNLQLIYVLEEPPEDWTGDRGLVTADVLRRHLPREFARYQYFVCGPAPMMDLVERTLSGLGVPADRVHTERFQMV